MATNTYVELATITPSGSSTSIVLNSIPSTYTDLILVGQYSKSAANSVRLWFNNDTSSGLYSQTILHGNGTTAAGGAETNANAFYMMDYLSASTTSTHTTIAHIQNYANTNTFKTVLERGGSGATGATAAVGIWRNTNAITRIDVGAGSGTFSAGTTFSLYGVQAWANTEASPKASGGYVSSDSSYWYHAFPWSSTFTPNQSLTADILVVAGGGGGGGGNGGGGGGAGGVLGLTSQSLSATGYTVTIGAGGAAETDGVSSSFASSIALKGARGANASANGPGGSGTYGSGGGLGRDGGQFGGAGTSGQGFAGGNSAYPTTNGGSGGGGAGGAGQDVVNGDGENYVSPHGDGGIGTNTYSSWLSSTGFGVEGYIAGGGGGSAYQTARNPAGGRGGGGRGTMRDTGSLGATPAIANTGSGGGGGGTGAFKSGAGAGGSGLVIVRYAK